jgi:hypothetical protein
MPSGKKSKQMRRAAAAAPPPVVSKGGSRRRQADKRVLLIAAAVIVLAGIGIGLAIALSGGGSKVSSTIPTIASTTTPPAIARTRGLAWRRRTPPFETTGGGAATAWRRACFDFLPLGTGGKSSFVVGAGGGER